MVNLEKEFVFYASYHHNKWNKLIHLVCIWPILWSGFVLGNFVPYLTKNVTWFPWHPINVSFVVGLYYSAYYLRMEKKWAGLIGSTLIMVCVFSAHKFIHMNCCDPLQTAIGIQLLGWGAQFLGHYAFEGRAPALFDNVMQAFVMAPFFVLLEVLFFCGYRKDLQRSLSRKVDREIANFQRSRK